MNIHHPGPDNKTPIPSICGTCRAPVWHAIIDGGTFRLDPTPLTIAAEVIHRLAGRMTYEDAPGRKLAPRWIERIRHSTPLFVLAAHTCTPPPHPPLVALWPERATTVDSEEIPF